MPWQFKTPLTLSDSPKQSSRAKSMTIFFIYLNNEYNKSYSEKNLMIFKSNNKNKNKIIVLIN